ncbi:hypothetical protein BO78DRAFT_47575 [Aspergillus sclerotiicarbonarius CBS 121057]|uniref:Uncharacterized protein n=1 Tax=Aspergillus sclerotiicarbonarius (strain CBS 121057 / IBT 28362) TaxID=1448318 RepID=A0A319EG17_ASPSB|nr:hypothetical protein BO78DRAFT_47575 [Aspergillus sclerotiicarbonarius CBS 121057]
MDDPSHRADRRCWRSSSRGNGKLLEKGEKAGRPLAAAAIPLDTAKRRAVPSAGRQSVSGMVIPSGEGWYTSDSESGAVYATGRRGQPSLAGSRGLELSSIHSRDAVSSFLSLPLPPPNSSKSIMVGSDACSSASFSSLPLRLSPLLFFLSFFS